MELPGLQFHHFGLAVRQPDKALHFVKSLGYAQKNAVFDPLQNTHLIWCTAPRQPDIEIVSPGEGETPLEPILQRFQLGIYHLCFETRDLAAALGALEKSRVRAVQVVAPTPAVLFEGAPVSFYQVPGFGLIEIVDFSDV